MLGWMAVSGAPMSRWFFANRTHAVWLGYAPIVGVGLHLLALNVAAWALPGLPGSWLGLTLASCVAFGLGLRLFRKGTLRRRLAPGPLLGAAFFLAVLTVGLANRTNALFIDEPWHLPLASTIARGFFPPVSPVSPTVGAAYHYGVDLLAATLMNAAGTPPWTAFYLLSPFLSAVVAVTALALARDLGAPPALAGGAGLVAAYIGPSLGTLLAGVPGPLYAPAPQGGLGEFVWALGIPASAVSDARVGPVWLNAPYQALGLSLILFLAGALGLPAGTRRWTALAGGLGCLPLAETAVFLLTVPALAAWSVVQAWRLPRRERMGLGISVAAGVTMAVLMGGAVTDGLLRRTGGPAPSMGINPDPLAFSPGFASGGSPLAVGVGALVLMLVVVLGALAFRSVSLGLLGACAAAGFVLKQILVVNVSGVDPRLLTLAYALAAIGTVCALAMAAARLPMPWRWLGGTMIVVFLVAPTVLPRLVSSVRLAQQGIDVGYPRVHDPIVRTDNPTRYAAVLREEWPALDWMRRWLPTSARVLALDPSLVSMTSGLPAPMSGRTIALFNPLPAPAFVDATTYLARQDLEDLGVTHVYVTPALVERLASSARLALQDATQFREVFRHVTPRGGELRVVEVLSQAGTDPPSPHSLRRLAELGDGRTAVTVAIPVNEPEGQTVLLTFPRGFQLFGPSTYLPRTDANPSLQPYRRPPPQGLTMTRAEDTPTTLGMDRSDARWSGYGWSAYAVPNDAWSRPWRPGTEPDGLPADVAAICDGSASGLQFRVLGGPGDRLYVGPRAISLTGVPQDFEVADARCPELRIRWEGQEIAPFVQVRRRAAGLRADEPAAGLGFDTGLDGDTAVIHLWYRNPGGTAFEDGTELRMYRADDAGVAVASRDLTQSAAWWAGPLVLSVERQMAQLRFRARPLTLEGAGIAADVGVPADGLYFLALTLAGLPEGSGALRVRQVIPLLAFEIRNGHVAYTTLSGIVAIQA